MIIAEIGVNHGGIQRAYKLIKKAKDVGASAVKFQTFSADKLVSFNTPLATHHKKILNQNFIYDLIKKLN